ncbi:MAG TPA: GrpB family protein [Longimicrobiaceae bacterium]|nr:GrpB family protein [Longimicrobiaceae bacterium]
MTHSPLGLESGTVRLAPYDPAWPGLFAAEAARLAPVLEAHGLSLRLEHVGSTSVPGLAAKPVLDILAGRPPGEGPERHIAALVAAGYDHRGEQGIPGREFFRRGTPRSYHVHMVEVGSPQWRRHLAFRDHLRAHPEDAAAYSALKAALAARFPRDRETYTESKAPFITEILARAAIPES